MTACPPGWTAIILAGQRPGVDPLASAFGQSYKALVEIGGIAMVRRVVDTLLGVADIKRIVVLAQDPSVFGAVLPVDKRLTLRASSSGISTSIAAVAGTRDATWPVLVTTADHPLLTQAMVAEFIAGAADCDVAVGMVEKATMDAAYPGNQRTWRYFKGGAYSGANLFALRSQKAGPALHLWASAEADRKKQLGLLWHFGPVLALRAFTRSITLGDGLKAAGIRLGLTAKPVILSQAEAAIDVDKPSDHQLAERILVAR